MSRAGRLAALGDPARLAIVDELSVSDRMPSELQASLALPSNLLAHHLDVLERVGLIVRTRSSGDRRRRYVQLQREALRNLVPSASRPVAPALFVCTQNSARSQLAAALWCTLTGAGADSAGTAPAERVHPKAIAAARRAGLDLGGATPKHLDALDDWPELVITVCDQAHEELGMAAGWVHWSIPDPVPDGRAAAFNATVSELRRRIADRTTEAA